jgi:hypothetical protein
MNCDFQSLFPAYRFPVCLPGLISTSFLLNSFLFSFSLSPLAGRGREGCALLFVAVIFADIVRTGPNNTQWKHLTLYMYHSGLFSLSISGEPI